MANTSNAAILYEGQPIQNISDFDAKPSSGNKSVHRGITSDREPIGFRKGQKPDWALSWKYTDLEGGQGSDPDWMVLWLAETEFSMARERDASADLWEPCIISEISTTTENDGTTVYSVSALALRYRSV